MSKLPTGTDRRAFLGGLTGAALVGSVPLAAAASIGEPLPISRHIKALRRRDETLLRRGGSGSTNGLTCTANGDILATMFEGAGWAGVTPGLYFTSALMSIKGEPNTAQIEAVPGYPVQPAREFFHVNGLPKYSGCDLLAIGETVYQFIGTNAGPLKSINGDWVYTGPPATKLIYSPDNGTTWFNQDGTTPVRRETAEQQSDKTMLFWDQPRSVFQFPILLQMGNGYEDNRDGFVYGYATREPIPAKTDPSLRNAASQGNDLIIFRVPTQRVLERRAYEFFLERLPNGDARWGSDIHTLSAAHRFLKDWRCSSVVHFKPLGVYIMAAARERYIDSKDTIAWSGPASLGFFTSPTPWGPWTLIHQDDSWSPGHSPLGGCRMPMIVPNWIAPDGSSFWLVWTDMYHKPTFRMDFITRLFFLEDLAEFNRGLEEYRHFMPYYRLNIQRVDVELA